MSAPRPGGPPPSFRQRQAALRRAMLDTITEEAIRQTTQVLQQKAVQGDLAAIKLLYAYKLADIRATRTALRPAGLAVFWW